MSEGNLPSTKQVAEEASGGNLPSTKKAAQTPSPKTQSIGDARPPKGRRVVQYSPEWVEHALAGGGIMQGNYLLD